jgi:hypothetical protein
MGFDQFPSDIDHVFVTFQHLYEVVLWPIQPRGLLELGHKALAVFQGYFVDQSLSFFPVLLSDSLLARHDQEVCDGGEAAVSELGDFADSLGEVEPLVNLILHDNVQIWGVRWICVQPGRGLLSPHNSSMWQALGSMVSIIW